MSETMTDHARGCQGREYTCTCGYDEQLSTLYSNAIARAEKAEELVAEYRDHSCPYWQDRAEKAEEALRVATSVDVHAKLIEALCDVAHDIDNKKVVIHFSPRLPGHNALNQLLTALEARFEPPKPLSTTLPTVREE